VRFRGWTPVVNNTACVIAVNKIIVLKESVVPIYSGVCENECNLF
jgi:hypothetical protein